MKAKLLLDGGAPKVPPEELRKLVIGTGLRVTSANPDFGIVVGGDGRFSRYGRTEDIPLLFVGVRSKLVTGSRAFLAQTTYDELEETLGRIVAGEYTVDEYRRLAVRKNGKEVGEVFTDVFLQRGNESNSLRYRVKVRSKTVSFVEAAIGDGVVVATYSGSSGYYSYPDRINGDWMDPTASSKVDEDEVGVCHIAPSFTERSGTRKHPLRYVLPWGCRIELSLFRGADARLYGVTGERAGVRVRLGDTVTILPGKKSTKIIRVG